MLKRGRHAEAGRSREPIRPARLIDIFLEELDAREMPAGATRPMGPVGAAARVMGRSRDGVEQAAAVEGLDRGHRQAAQAERQPLQG